MLVEKILRDARTIPRETNASCIVKLAILNRVHYERSRLRSCRSRSGTRILISRSQRLVKESKEYLLCVRLLAFPISNFSIRQYAVHLLFKHLFNMVYIEIGFFPILFQLFFPLLTHITFLLIKNELFLFDIVLSFLIL